MTLISKSQCEDYYWNDKGKLRFGKKVIDVDDGKYFIHRNSAYLTRWDNKMDFLIDWSISFCGHLINRPFKNVSYDPMKEHFQMVGQYHGEDDHAIFLFTIDNEGHPHGPPSYVIKFINLDGADRSSFQELEKDARYGKDANQVYFKFWTIEKADPETFEILSSQFPVERKELKLRNGQKLSYDSSIGIARDKNHVYWNQLIMKDVLPQDFELIGLNQCLWKGKKYEIQSSTRLIPIQ